VIIRLRDLVPAGHRMCCLCFEAIPVDQLWVDNDGMQWDMCVPCKAADDEAVRLRDQATCVE
jgi:hypothetical protein